MAEKLAESYRFLRSVESGIRLMNTSARHDLPSDPAELKRLAYLLRQSSAAAMRQKCQDTAKENRKLFRTSFR